MEGNVCPRCGGGIPNDAQRGEYPGALSRFNNLTEICSDCGTEEAFAQWTAPRQGRNPVTALDPVRGDRAWVHPEVAFRDQHPSRGAR